MTNPDQRPIVVKRVVKGGGHHGGAWKVAYADFVTAMMAFFLLMWLMGSTNKEQKAAISNYFNNPSAEIGASPTPKPGGMNGPGGASTSPIDLGGGYDQPTVSRPGEEVSVADREQQQEALAQAQEQGRKQAQEQEQARMNELKSQIQSAMSGDPALEPFKDQLLIDMTDEGLRLQIVDREHRPMFELGSARLLPASKRILDEIAKVVAKVPNRISITGHTDARPYSRTDYGNWELSADRANAARRELVSHGVPESKIARVVGLASSVLFDPNDSMAPINRRIAIIVLKQKAYAAEKAREGPLGRKDLASDKGHQPQPAAVPESGQAEPQAGPKPKPKPKP